MKKHLAGFIAEQAARLEAVGIDSGAFEVEWMLCHVLQTDRLHLYLEGEEQISPEALQHVETLMQRRLTRHPLQYILGESWFYGRRFAVTPDVMVPTPETELLCEAAIRFVQQKGLSAPQILDIGVGSGVIALTTAAELPLARVTAVDLSEAALVVARRNAATLGVQNRVTFMKSDFFSAVEPRRQFDLVLSNPPYIATPDYAGLAPEVHADPQLALLAGEDGLDAVRRILRDAPDYLSPSGRLMFEIGYNQADTVAELTGQDPRYGSIVILKDLNDIDRVVILGLAGGQS